MHSSTASLDRPTDEVALDRLLLLARACWGGERLGFDYRASDGALTTRRVEPYRVVSAAGHWYLMAYDLERDDWRTFRLDRMVEVTPIGSHFRPRPGPDPVTYVRASIAVAPYRFTARVLIHASVTDVARHVSTASALLEPVGTDRCVLVAGGDDLELMAWHVARLPFRVEVQQPAELRTAAAALARRLLVLAARVEPIASVHPVTDVISAAGTHHPNT